MTDRPKVQPDRNVPPGEVHVENDRGEVVAVVRSVGCGLDRVEHCAREIAYRVRIRCAKCGDQHITIRGMNSDEQARDLCGLLDGSSPFYVIDPREDPNSKFGRCYTCGGLITATVVGPEDLQ